MTNKKFMGQPKRIVLSYEQKSGSINSVFIFKAVGDYALYDRFNLSDRSGTTWLPNQEDSHIILRLPDSPFSAAEATCFSGWRKPLFLLEKAQIVCRKA